MLRPERRSNVSGDTILVVFTYHGTTFVDGNQLVLGNSIASSYDGSLELMDSYDGKRVPGFKDCFHYKLERKIAKTISPLSTWYNSTDHSQGRWFTGPTSSPTCYDAWGSLNSGWTTSPADSLLTELGTCYDPVVGLPVLVVPNGGGSFTLPLPSRVDNLVSSAISAMLPGIRPLNNTSLVNSILELKDFATVPRTLKGIVQTLSATQSLDSKIGHLIAHNVGRGRRNTLFELGRLAKSKHSKKTLRSILRAGSDSYLQAEFNFLPLLQDIVSVKDALSYTRKKLRELIARANEPQKRHYSVELFEEYPDSDVLLTRATQSFFCAPVVTIHRNVRYYRRMFNATMEYSYSLPSLDLEESLMGAWLDTLGVNLNPRIIWNAIPWSFVVDWVVNVNSWLDNFRNRNIEPVVDIRGFCWSIDVQRSVLTDFTLDSNSPVARLDEHSYLRRVPTRSAMLAGIKTSGLSSKEFSLAAALALT